MKKSLSLILLSISALIFICAGIDLYAPDNYANQTVPGYIQQDNTTSGNAISDKGATLGRVLFYDKQLSLNGSIACASCHKQEFGFSDTALLSEGYEGGKTGRHSMRLINSRFSEEVKFFWDERAITLEDQSTKPIQDHVEMGFSGQSGNPGIDSLLNRLKSISYYPQLFNYVFGDDEITEERIQKALAQFVRSIQSFDSKFDAGLANAPNINAPFANFTTEENTGKQLFLAPPPAGGAGCQGCHRGPEFDIDPATNNNGVIHVADGAANEIDLTNTKAPSLRDLFNPQGILNGPLMHNAEFPTIESVIDHYNSIPNNPANTNLDNRLRGPGGTTQQLNLTDNQKAALIAFLKTLSGNDVYTNPIWSDPFETDGSINIKGLTSVSKVEKADLSIYPNPSNGQFFVKSDRPLNKLFVMDQSGRRIITFECRNTYYEELNIHAPAGIYFVQILMNDGSTQTKKIVINP